MRYLKSPPYKGGTSRGNIIDPGLNSVGTRDVPPKTGGEFWEWFLSKNTFRVSPN